MCRLVVARLAGAPLGRVVAVLGSDRRFRCAPRACCFSIPVCRRAVSLSQNDTKAFSYFERAARFESDGDTMFNTGMCHMLGKGTDVNVTEAKRCFDVAVAKFGHFGAVYEIGKLYYDGSEASVRDNDHPTVPQKQCATDTVRGKAFCQSHHGWQHTTCTGKRLNNCFANKTCDDLHCRFVVCARIDWAGL